MFIDEPHAIITGGESQASESQAQVIQHEISNSFILQILLHPTAKKIMIYLLLLGTSAVLFGVFNLAGLREGKQQTQMPQISKTAAAYLVGLGGSATLIGAYGFFFSIKYARSPVIISADEAPVQSRTLD